MSIQKLGNAAAAAWDDVYGSPFDQSRKECILFLNGFREGYYYGRD